MRIAFFGGTFDPPHLGHLALAEAAIARLKLDRVLMAPVAAQPLKSEGAEASFADRMAMTRLAADANPRVAASDADGPRPDGKPNYTIDTVAEIRSNLAPGDRLFFLAGADVLFSLRRWRRPAEIMLLCDWILAARPEFPLQQLPALLPEGIAAGPKNQEKGLTTLELTRQDAKRSCLYLLKDFRSSISATEIRRALASGETASSALAPEVLDYIRERGLYGTRQATDPDKITL